MRVRLQYWRATGNQYRSLTLLFLTMRWAPAVFLLVWVASTAAWGQEAARTRLDVAWEGPEPLRTLFQKSLPAPTVEAGERRAGSVRPWVRDVRRRVPEMAAAEGYFSATVEIVFAEDRDHARVIVALGPRTTVGDVEIRFTGDLAQEDAERAARREALRESWALKPGQALRSVDWEDAKSRLREKLLEEDYAAGRIAESEARVDEESARAKLTLVLDSGPRFTLGEVVVEGIDRYPESVVRRLVDIKPGERYRLPRLLGIQHSLQSGAWFSSVVVDIERDPEKPQNVPVKVTLTERPAREIGVALGYGTDSGARAEVAARHRNLLGRGYDLQSAIRVDRGSQIGYADVYLPPSLTGSRHGEPYPTKDSFGFLTEHTAIQKLETRRFALAGYRQWTLDTVETRCGLSFQVERSSPEGSNDRTKRALAPVVAGTWRHVDDLFDPQRGWVLNAQFAAAAKSVVSTQDFFKAYAQVQFWLPISPRDQLLLRTEVGSTIAKSRDGIPEDFLFRAGGSRSNRGYAYQSLGPHEGDAVVGGRYLLTASVDYIHWLNETWGAAVFYDIGNASDSARDYKPDKSYGVGARFRTPAGPLALDLAFAERPRKFRLAFSVTVAF
jgi:translocation and assembly module TamA